MAEVYGVYELRGLPLMTAARLACGLPEDCRARLKIRGERFSFDRLLSILTFDALAQVRYYAARAAGFKPQFPQPMYRLFAPQSREGIEGFDSAEEFERERERLLKEV